MKKEYLDVIEAILSDEYARGYNAGTNHGIEITEAKDYEQGLNDAWECARKIVRGNYDDLFSNYKEPIHAIRALDASDAIAKIKEYEEKQTKKSCDNCGKNYCGNALCFGNNYCEWAPKQTDDEIKIGDEVTDGGEWKGVVTWVSPDYEYLVVMLDDGTAIRWKKKEFKKTGQHFSQIAEVLKQM